MFNRFNFSNPLILKKIVSVLFFSLLCLVSVLIPLFAYYVGKTGTNDALTFKVFLFLLGLFIFWGWFILIQKIIRDMSAWSFDIGLAWNQYTSSNHFYKKGYLRNEDLYKKGVDLITRAFILLNEFYKDNDYDISNKMHGESVCHLLKEEKKRKRSEK